MSARYLRGCAIGGVATLLVALIRTVVSPWLGATAPLLLFPAVVAVAAWVGGIWAGLFTTVLSAALGLVLFVRPLDVIAAGAIDQGILLSLFGAEGALIAYLTSALRGSQRHLARAVAEEHVLRSRAESVNLLKHEFLGIVSHELRTPLTVVLGSIWKIKQSSDPIARQVADTIERNAKAQVRTIDDLLYVSEALAGHRRLEFSPVDLEAICVSSAAALREDAWRRTITIAVIAPEQRAIVLGDPEPLRRTVTALVSNAVKFSNAGSSVEIALAVAPSQIDVMVTDSGIGMAPEVLKAIFEPFWQADSSTTRSHGGLGLGLTAAREVAAQHGGVISARSEGPGRGARFTLTLPRSRESLNEDAPALQRA